jgi:cytoplasmic iron level regulating protein YaaA (DUF328/UPF0246 family)
MIIVISPAKTLDFSKSNETLPMTKPKFIDEAKELVQELKGYDAFSLEKLMKISPKLAKLNNERFQMWSDCLDSGRQCLIAFKGEVFKGIDVGSYTMEDYFYANDKLRILSGLYGVLKPFDGINLYRLEMGIKFKFNQHKNIYEYWGNKLVNSIAEDIGRSKNNILINLASYEYFKAIEDINKLERIKVITPIFKEYKNGEYKIITIMAKRARGLMTSFIIKNQIENIDELKLFNYEGYEFNEELSSKVDLVFTRELH